MLTLGINTTSKECSVALCLDTQILIQSRSEPINSHSDVLMPMILESLYQAGQRLEKSISFTSIDRFGVSVGPGSFTGIRVGLATVRGFRLATGRPVYGFSTFEVLAYDVPTTLRHGRLLMIALNVQGQGTRVFVQRFSESLVNLGPVVSLDECDFGASVSAGSIVVAGDGATQLATFLEQTYEAEVITVPQVIKPQATCIAMLAATRNVSLPLRPFYLRDPNVTASYKTL